MNIKRLKYVVFISNFGNESCILFGDAVQHDTFKYLNPVSAGFVAVGEDGSVSCYGKSISLGIKSRGADDDWLVKHILIDSW